MVDRHSVTHVIHDVDRDGLGSAAIVCAQLGPERVCLHPTKVKDVRALLSSLDGEVFVLDIGAPPSWDGVPEGLAITWVDHHLATWRSTPPPNVRAILPTTDKPAVTMSLLIKHGLVNIPGVITTYVGKLCGGDADFEWGLVFDALTRLRVEEWPVAVAALPSLLAAGPLGERVPDVFIPLIEATRHGRETCHAILDRAPTDVLHHTVVVAIADAKGIPLAQFSLELQRRHPGRVAILVHRGTLLYCARASGRPGLDLVKHFSNRGRDPKGHSYVVSLRLPRGDVAEELRALLIALEDAAR